MHLLDAGHVKAGGGVTARHGVLLIGQLFQGLPIQRHSKGYLLTYMGNIYVYGAMYRYMVLFMTMGEGRKAYHTNHDL